MAYDFKSLTKQADEASNRGKFYTDFEDVDPNVLHQISDLTEWIRTKGKGSDVREIIAQLFERTWLEATKEGNANMEVAKARGTEATLVDRLQAMDGKISQTTTDITRTESRIDGLIANAGNGTVPSELTDIRVSNDGTVYATAGEAIRQGFNEIENILNYVVDKVNLFNKNELLDNKYYDTNGILQVGNNTTQATDLIPVKKGEYRLYSTENGNFIFGVSIYDKDRKWVRNLIPYELNKKSASVLVTDNEAFVAITINNHFKDSTVFATLENSIGYFVAHGSSENTMPPLYKARTSTEKTVKSTVIVVDKNGLGDFTNISDAVASITDDSVLNPYTIMIKPGIYEECVRIRGGRNISLTGVNFKDCIIRDTSGLYENSPLEIQGNCIVDNLTIISNHESNSAMPLTGNKGYAIHADYEGAGITTIRNCKLVSHQSAAIGAGLHQDQTLIIENCELISYTPNDSSWTVTPNYGALFVHAAMKANVSNQRLLVSNCRIESNTRYAVAFSGSSEPNSEMTIELLNNFFWSNIDGKADSVVKEWYSPKYSSRCYGNNVAKLNG
ncbi:TPA: hypothetical protein U0908_000639 [Streptococcus suis 14A]|uniref:pectinesterase family protein n=1 Tax=Streptococcus suis TaxID=1307 RepID=UPI0004155A9A|nr:pectinesterase family protein [Streptococcus suis]HEM3198477.1 hypothetical protein [Streptococcus suis 14A]